MGHFIHLPFSRARTVKMQRQSFLARLRQQLCRTKLPGQHHEDSIPSHATETSPLLKSDSCLDHDHGIIVCVRRRQNIDQPEQGILSLDDNPVTWLHEARTIASYSLPLTVTFLLQYSVDALSLIAAGRLGKRELGAVSLANMSAAITCFAPIQGLATSLDTLCAQAYGSGRKHLIGLYCQRMALFLLCLCIPISILWLYAEPIMKHLVSDAESARLASLYLVALTCAIPGYVIFEIVKRFLQAQGLFQATTYVLLVAAPCHAIVVSVLIRKFGFIGAPMAVAATRTLIAVLVLLYVRFINGSGCWGGFSHRALTNWWTMIRLAIPGMIMVEAEYLAFEVMIIASSQFGTDYLAVQGILSAIATISFQVPFSMSIAASTRIAGLIGAGAVGAGKVAAKMALTAVCITGCLNFIVYILFQARLPFIFTDDPVVARLATQLLPMLGLTTFLEGVGATAHGLLRGIGRQSIGGPATLSSYYFVALPTSLALGFGLDWKLHGLLWGLTLGLVVVSLIEYTYLCMANWNKAATEATARNAAG